MRHRRWLRYFAPPDISPQNNTWNGGDVALASDRHLDFNCFNPWNLQARTLTCTRPQDYNAVRVQGGTSRRVRLSCAAPSGARVARGAKHM